jgi:hypothetical protein
MAAVNVSSVSYVVPLLGFFLGFAFGVGCALAVMYSIYAGGYRAAVKDSLLDPPPERWLAARAKVVDATEPRDETGLQH